MNPQLTMLSTHSTYDMLRHLADSWGLLAMALIFLALCLWPFRPGAGAISRRCGALDLRG